MMTQIDDESVEILAPFPWTFAHVAYTLATACDGYQFGVGILFQKAVMCRITVCWVCHVRSLNSFRYHCVVNSGVFSFSTDSWMGYIHSVRDVYVVTGGESSSHIQCDEESSCPLYWMRFFLTCISDL